jgi:hypothetical protein
VEWNSDGPGDKVADIEPQTEEGCQAAISLGHALPGEIFSGEELARRFASKGHGILLGNSFRTFAALQREWSVSVSPGD